MPEEMSSNNRLIQGVGSVAKFVFLAKLESCVELSLTMELNFMLFGFFCNFTLNSVSVSNYLQSYFINLM